MADDVEKRVVQMEFDNSKFDKNIKKSSNTLDDFKKKLQFKDVSRGMEEVTKKFTALDAVAFSVINNITNRIVNLGIQLIKSLSIDNISAGWTKFEQKATSSATLIAQKVKIAGKELETEAERIAAVNEQLDRLNWFTDETSYSFTDMIDNIGKFTAAGQDLDVAVKAMEGIATWAALSGQNAVTASRAMYQLAQTLGKGYVQLQDWRSIQNANMDTQEFRQTVLETAVALGELTKQGNEFISKTGKKINATNFVDTLSEKWFTSDVLIKTLGKYSAAVDQIYEIASREDLTTSQVMEKYGDTLDEFGVKAFKAAQECRTLNDALNSIKDAVSTGWMNTFDLIIGKYEEAREVWSDLADSLYEAFVESNNFRNSILKVWSALEGRADLFGEHGSANQGAFWNLYDAIIAVKDAVKTAWDAVFPISVFKTSDEIINDLGNKFKNLTKRLQEYTKKIKETVTNNKTLQGVLKGIATVIKIIAQALTGIRYILDPIITVIKGVIEDVLVRLGFLGEDLSKLESSAKRIEKISRALGSAIESVLNILDIRGNLDRLFNFLDSIFGMTFNGKSVINDLTTFFSNLGESIKDFKIDVKEITKDDAFAPLMAFINGAVEFAKGVYSLLSSSLIIIGEAFSFIGQLFQIIGDLFSGKLWQNYKGWIIGASVVGGILALVLAAFKSGRWYIESINNAINPLGYALGGLTDDLWKLTANEGLKALATLLAAVGKMFLEVAIGFVLIASVPMAGLIKGFAVLGVLTGLIVTTVVLIHAINKATSDLGNKSDSMVKTIKKLKDGSKTIKKEIKNLGESFRLTTEIAMLAGLVKSVGLAMVELSVAFMIIGKLSWEEWGRGMIAMGTYFTLIAGLLLIMEIGEKNTKGKTSKIDTKGIKRLGKNLLAFAISFRIIGTIIEKFGAMNPTQMWIGFAGFAAMAAVFTSIIIGLNAMINLTNKMNVSSGKSKKASKQISDIALLVGTLSLSMLVMSHLIEKMGLMDPTVLENGIITMAAEMLALGVFMIALNAIPKNNSNIKKVAPMLLSISAMMVAFGLSMLIVKDIPWYTMLAATLSFSMILGAVIALVAIGTKATTSANKIKSITAMMVMVGAMMTSFGLSMLIIKDIPWYTMLAAVLAITTLLASVAAMATLATKGVTSVGSLMAISAALIILSAAMTVFIASFKQLEDISWNSIFKGLVLVIGGLSALAIISVIVSPVAPVMVALAASMFLIGAGLLMAASSLTLFANGIAPAAEAIVESSDLIKESMSVLASAIGESLISGLSTALDGIIVLSPKISESLIAVLENVFTVLNATGPRLIETVTILLTSLLDSLSNNMTDISDSLIGIILGVINSLTKNMADIVGALVSFTVELIKQLSIQLVPKIPEILGYIYDIIVGLVAGLVQYIVPIAGMLTKIVLILIAYVLKLALISLGGIAADLIAFIGGLLLLLVQVIEGMANVIYETLKYIFVVIVKLLSKVFRELAPMLVKAGKILGLSLARGALAALSESVVGDILEFLGIHVKDAVDNMDAMIDNEIKELEEYGSANGVKDAIKTAATEIMNTVSDVTTFMDEITDESLGAITDSTEKAMEQLGDTFAEGGEQIINGFVNSVNDGKTDVEDSVNDSIVDPAIDTTKEGLDEHSPSKVFAKIGKFLIEGFVKGIDDNASDATDSIESAFSSIISTANDMINDNIDDTIVIRPVMDLSNITEGTESIASLMSSISGGSVSVGTNLAGSTANEINRARNQNASAQTVSSVNNEGDVYNTTFNVTTNDPEELARQTDVILQRQRAMAQMAKGGAK